MATKEIVVPKGGDEAALDEWRRNPWPTTDRPRFRTPVGEKSRTRQSEKDSCDINLIVKRHTDTGHVSHLNPAEPKFGDFSSGADLKQAIDQVAEANDRFNELPVEVRRAAQNNPYQLLEMLETEDGQIELAEAGLVLTEQPEPPRRVEEQPEPPPTTKLAKGAEGTPETSTD